MQKIFVKNLDVRNFFVPLHSQNDGVVAQVVEQWTENPCVAGSTPADTTKNGSPAKSYRFRLYKGQNYLTSSQVYVPISLSPP